VDVTTPAAIAYAGATTGVIVFQVALALGAPWGSYAMGGAVPGRFPPAMRLAALVQAALLGALVVVVLSGAGLVLPALSDAFPWSIWVAVAVASISVVMNAISPSAGERRIWLPVGLLLLACSITVALSAG
jgi:hypothetical protein